MIYNKKYERHMPRCLECGDQIRYGRTDKKFCSEICKSRFHNEQLKTARQFRTKVNSILWRNYQLLDEVLQSGRDSADLIELTTRGFVPGIITSYSRVGKHDVYNCYDIKYIMSRTRLFSIGKIQNL